MAEAAFELKRIRDEAAGWYAKLNNTTVTTDTLRAFRDWRRKDDRHDEAYLEIEAFWKRAAKLEHDKDIQRAAGAALERPPETERRGPMARPGGRSLATALVALLLVAGLAAAWPRIFGQAYATGVGEQRIIRLADGSQLRLDTDSQVRVKLSEGSRHITLGRGRALFDVAHDPARPFTVSASETQVRAIGTRFDVRRDAEEVTITLFQGEVEVSGGASAVTLTPGEQAEVASPTATPKVRAIDTLDAERWATGQLVFRSQALKEAVREVNRYNTTQITLEGSELGERRVSGVFEAGDTEAFVVAARDLFNLKVDRAREGQIVLRPAT